MVSALAPTGNVEVAHRGGEILAGTMPGCHVVAVHGLPALDSTIEEHAEGDVFTQ